MAVFRLPVTLFVTVIIITNMNCKLDLIFCTEMTHVHTKSLVDNDMSLCHPLHTLDHCNCLMSCVLCVATLSQYWEMNYFLTVLVQMPNWYTLSPATTFGYSLASLVFKALRESGCDLLSQSRSLPTGTSM